MDTFSWYNPHHETYFAEFNFWGNKTKFIVTYDIYFSFKLFISLPWTGLQ